MIICQHCGGYRFEVGEVECDCDYKTANRQYPPPLCSALALAKQFHDIYERLAPQHGYVTRTETRQFDPDSPNGRLMIAVCKTILEQNATRHVSAERR